MPGHRTSFFYRMNYIIAGKGSNIVHIKVKSVENKRISEKKISYRTYRVNQLRLALNLSMDELGGIMGISGSTVSRHIRGNGCFSDMQIARFAHFADTPAVWFDA